MKYINLTNRTVKVRGVEFAPGDIHEVDGSINIPGFALTSSSPKRPVAKGKGKTNKKK
jgi:hypothetical protein